MRREWIFLEGVLREKLTVPSQRCRVTLNPHAGCLRCSSYPEPNLTRGVRWNKNVGCFPGVGSWRFFLEPPQAERGDTVTHHHGGGGWGRMVPPGLWRGVSQPWLHVRISSGIFFKEKYLIRTPPQTCYFRTLMVRLAPALVF